MKKESISVKVIATKHQPKERILMMTTLTQNTLHFNRSIKLSNDGGMLSSDTGELIFREFDEKIGFSQTIAKHLHLKMNARIAFMKMNSYFVKKFISSSQIIMR
ncbi:hypothetical protein AN161_16705, partial [Lysinibacillus sp. FJAT-14222]